MTDFRYKAFISYSWSDAAWGKWVHTALETYRTPKALVGKETAIGPVPAALHPLFKDREEEAAGASIGAAVEAALGASEFLIVICSPRSAQSQWVNHEVAWFKTHRDPTHILALIVDGEPGSRDAECFPAALTHRVLADLTVTDEAEDAPLAADARDSGDGKRRAKLKLAAAMLGVGLDELVRRDERRRALRTRIVVGASLSLAVVMSGLTWFAVQARNEAQHQRAESDGLVEFMLTDLRKKLEPVGRLDALDVVGQRALKYYAGQKPDDLDPDALGRRSRALHLVGEVRDLRGDSEAALVAFRSAAATTGELLRRDPKNGQRIFDHAQSVYWVGYIAYQRGETKEAEAAFRDYKKYADQLVALDPKKPDWQMEVSYAESNLGTLLFEQSRYAEAERSFAVALGFVEAASARAPDDVSRRIEVGQAISWLASAREKQNRIESALDLLRRELAIYQDVLKVSNQNTDAIKSAAVALSTIGRLELGQGNIGASLDASQMASSLCRQLLALDPSNTDWRQIAVIASQGGAEVAFFAGKRQLSAINLASARESLEFLRAKDRKNVRWNIDFPSDLELLEARQQAADGQFASAEKLLLDAIARLNRKSDTRDPYSTYARNASLLKAGDVRMKLGHEAEARSLWRAALEAARGPDVELSSPLLALRFAALRRMGLTERANRAKALLDQRGYKHPSYLQDLGRTANDS